MFEAVAGHQAETEFTEIGAEGERRDRLLYFASIYRRHSTRVNGFSSAGTRAAKR